MPEATVERTATAPAKATPCPGCHPTDPSNPVPDGMKPAPSNVATRECAGAHILLQREVMAAQAIGDHAGPGRGWGLYRRLRPRGLTRDGLIVYLERVTFGGVPRLGTGHEVPKPDLNQPVDTADPTALPWPVRLPED